VAFGAEPTPEDWPMNEPTTIRYIGLDVHKDSISLAVAASDGKPAESPGGFPTTPLP
jgi:hypothetical protein